MEKEYKKNKEVEQMIQHIISILKGTTTFLIGFVFGMAASLIGLTKFLSIEVFGLPLFVPMIFAFVFVGFFVVIFFKKDKIEQINYNPKLK